MRARVAEIDQHSVAHVSGDKPLQRADRIGDGAVICGDDFAQILGVELRRECRRADEIAKHHRQLAAFGVGLRWCIGGRRGYRSGGRRGAERSNCSEQLAAMADRGHADADQVVGRQLRQHFAIDIVIAECSRVSFEPKPAQPRHYVHAVILGSGEAASRIRLFLRVSACQRMAARPKAGPNSTLNGAAIRPSHRCCITTILSDHITMLYGHSVLHDLLYRSL